MEVTVLGEYRPFGNARTTKGYTRDAVSTPYTDLSSTSERHSIFEAPSDDYSHTTTIRNNIVLPRYALYPPTQDGVIYDNLEAKDGSSQASSNQAPHGYDVEVFVQGSKVAWTQGGVLRKVLDFSSENEVVLQTLFAWFIVNGPSQNSNRERDRDREGEEDYEVEQLYAVDNLGADHQGRQQALVIILKDTVRIYFFSGESFSVYLPFGLHKAWAMDLGLLMERKPEPGEEMSEQMEGAGLPRFYMIMDPFNELQIVTLYRLPKQPSSSKSEPEEDVPRIRHLNGIVGDIFNTCVFLSNLDTTDRTVVTFDLLLNRHRVWRYASSMPSSLPFSRVQAQATFAGNMDMDIDVDADLQMRTDTYLFEIESDIHSASHHSTIFSAHAFDGSTVIGILDHEVEKLSCYQIVADQITVHLWTRPALSAVAVEATRKQQRDILIMSHDGALQLWTGFALEFISCHVDIAGSCRDHNRRGHESAGNLDLGGFRLKGVGSRNIASIVAMDTKATTHDVLYIVEMRDAVEDRVNLILKDATILRVRLDFTVRSSLVQECLDAISYALPVNVLWDFKHRFLQLQFDKDPQYESVAAENEWVNFTTTLLSYCNPSFTPPVMSSPKMQTRSLSGLSKKPAVSDSDWNFLLDSDIHRLLGNHPSFRDEPLTLPVSTSNPYSEMILQAQKLASHHFRGPATRQSLRLDFFYKFILMALHLVYEDRNINQATFKEGDMSTLLMLMSHIVRWNTWVDAYSRRDFTNCNNVQVPEVYMDGPTLPLEVYEYEPPDIFRWISDVVSHPTETKPFPTLQSLSSLRDPEQSEFPKLSSALGKQTRKITHFFTELMKDDGDGNQGAVRAVVNEGFTRTELDQLPFGISVPLREAIWRCRRNPSPDLSSDALSFIGRNDLAELASKHGPGYYMKPPSRETVESDKRQDIHSLCKGDVRQDDASEPVITGTEITNSDITDLRFQKDMRVAEAKRMLQSSILLKIRAKEEPQLNEQDLEASHQEILCKLALRTMALPVGRAILTFGTATPILNQKCPIPSINLSAKLVPTYGVTEIDLRLLGGEQALQWPSFHNGVAAGLRISPNSKDVSSSWIIYNRPDVLNCEHAGFLMALGLTGNLKALVKSHVWRYLSFKHELTSTGLLLGLACAHRGTMNTAITRVLSVHMPALLPQNGSDLNLSPVTQVACVLGIGLVYMETSHRRMAEVLLSEIGSASGNAIDSVNSVQECHSVAAGFGLGFITLGQGNKAMGLRDMRIVDSLVSYMPGSTDKNHEARTLAGTARGGDQGWHRHQAGIDVTSAGATVAMGLMYLKTNSKAIATKLSVPETQFLLDYITPDSLMLRVICRAIVLWNSIKPTAAWVLSQVPEYLKDVKTGGPPATESGPQSYYSILAGACFAMGLRFAGSGDKVAYGCIMKYLDMFLDLGRATRGRSYEESITKSTVRACLDVAVMAASMVMAGSGDLDLLRRLRKLHRRIKGDNSSYGSHLAHHMALGLLFLGGGGYTLGTSNRCVAALLCSLYPRLPSDSIDNRSHLQAFRHLWVLAVEPRCLVTRDASSGVCCTVPVRVHLKGAYYQSQVQMGLGCEVSMNYQQEAVQDEQPSQTTRTSERDTDASHTEATGLFWSSKLEMRTPCLLPELSTISKIEILGPRYWPITIDLSGENEDYSKIWSILKSRSISVMRHIGYLSYDEDPEGMRGILARPFPKVLTGGELGETIDHGGSRRRKQERLERLTETRRGNLPGGTRAWQSVLAKQHDWASPEGLDQRSASYGEDFCLTFLQDPQVASFASHLCRVQPGDHRDGSDAEKDEARAVYFTSVLYECLVSDKVEALGVHVWLYDIVNQLESLDELSWRTLWELRILMNYYNTQLRRQLTQVEQCTRTSDVAEEGTKVVLAAQTMEVDGSDTLVKISRVTEVVSKITKRVEQVMEIGRGDTDRSDWSLDRIARHYFAHGNIPSNRIRANERPNSLVVGGPIRSWGNGMNWFKVWLELNEVPGPDAIQGIKMALDNTREIWEGYVDGFHTRVAETEGGHNEARESNGDDDDDDDSGQQKLVAREGRSKLLKQVFSQAYPVVSSMVLDYLVD
ncbi:Anaphase-promoting complex subunit 1 [Modicella reniformis]|uniref:Anaphase-promoting complex subunit 1 n=1 Tax=Modicella reniformis TaxID=1440133 RepID=A0A9P6J167_9FUNG|nr:Anaphase-promoting complex subunit 1 [Modicella reniformis]